MSAVRAPRSLRLAGFGAATAVAATMAGGLAHAELVDSATPVESVTVTAGPLEHPYADPKAPYKTDTSASGKLTQPLLDVSKSVVVIPRQVIDDSGATAFRDLMRTQSGVTLGT